METKTTAKALTTDANEESLELFLGYISKFHTGLHRSYQDLKQGADISIL